MKKRLLPLILAGLLSFTLTACHGNQPNPEPAPVIPDDPAPITAEVPTEDPIETETPEEDPLAEGVVIDDNFDNDKDLAWSTYSNEGDFSLKKSSGEMVVEIRRTGSLDYSCQVYRDGFELLQGGVYEISFDIRSDIERPYQWRFQLNGGDYHAYYMEEDKPITTEPQTVKATFTMDEASDPAPRFCFNLGYFDGMDKEAKHNIYIDNFKVTLADASNATATEGLPEAIALKVNQIGYKPGDNKKVVATTSNAVSKFEIKNTSDNSVVYSGTFASEAVESPSGDGTTYTGDFSDFKETGTYYISVDGLDDSYQFTIAEDVYEAPAKEIVRMLYLQRCGCELTSDLAGDYAHPVCHNSTAKIYASKNTIDVSGGWHDAGDYGRYIVAGAKTVADLFLTYEESEASRGDDYDIPESGNGVPDILDEARYELEFMLKMQAESGGVYHKVTCAVFPGTVMPEEETAELIVCPISKTATGDFSAIMAKASVLYESYDAAFASKCLEASKKAYAYMEANAASDKTGFKNPNSISTGEYPDAYNSDEFIWAAVELFLATGDNAYQTKASELANEDFKMGLGWADMGTYAAYDFLKDENADKDSALTKRFTDLITQAAEEALQNAKTDPYFSTLRDYPWGSNMTIANNGMLFNMMYKLTGNKEYDDYARYQLDYLFGINPVGYCYVTGEGTLSPEHPHHRPSQAKGKAVPGMLVGGPNSEPADPYAIKVLEGRQGGACYVDNDTAYSINEITIYWNSPLIYLIEMYK